MRVLALIVIAGCSAPVSPDGGLISDGGNDARDGAVLLPDGGTQMNGDAGPGEPTLSSAVLFRDDFNAYADDAALRASYPEIRELGGRIALALDAGTGHALRLDYVNDAGVCANADVHVGKVLSGDVPTVVVTWAFLRPVSFTSCGDAGVEDFTLTRGATRTTFERFDGLWVVRAGTQVFTQHLRMATHAPDALADDTWHRVTLVLTRQSTPSMSDGVVQAWVDGALIIDLTGSTGTPAFSLATWPGALQNAGTQYRLVDSLAISTP